MLPRHILLAFLLATLSVACSSAPAAEDEETSEGALTSSDEVFCFDEDARASLKLDGMSFAKKDVCPSAGKPLRVTFVPDRKDDFDLLLKVRLTLNGKTAAEREAFKAKMKASSFKLTGAAGLTTRSYLETQSEDSLFFVHSIKLAGAARSPIEAEFQLASGPAEHTVAGSVIALAAKGKGLICGGACYGGLKCVNDTCQ